MSKITLATAWGLLVLSQVSVAGSSAPALTLKEIMQGLRNDVVLIADGMLTDDMGLIGQGAAGIADHPAIPPEQVRLVAAELGPEMPAFKQFDQAVHGLAVSIVTAAESQDREQIEADFHALVDGCLACHASYKERVANILNDTED